MRHRVLSIAALLVAASISTAHAQAAKTQKCKDGTTSTATGSGACSGHGGVDGKAQSASKKSSKAMEQTATKPATKAATPPAKKVASAPAKVTCTDGTLSKPGRGACSGHGGVKKS